MTPAKKTSKKAAPEKKPAVNAPLPPDMIGTKEAAELCGITPRLLRVILRDSGKGTGGDRYQWKKDDPFLKKLPVLIEEHRNAKRKPEAAKE
jgi:hypothetical protein